ncbi:hypothetical protein BXZ70DRAFT_1008677 [Cristinia sonorae]|uniref:DRBM domain-containing protein n=1 Tax=Cristinia sonorae TaxID=1940300 RepID=A0A8K0XP34_9AGAR|nr:hypothetical protein BXZ70DRAFT_1008677 [Cristinia sonorae]
MASRDYPNELNNFVQGLHKSHLLRDIAKMNADSKMWTVTYIFKDTVVVGEGRDLSKKVAKRIAAMEALDKFQAGEVDL